MTGTKISQMEPDATFPADAEYPMISASLNPNENYRQDLAGRINTLVGATLADGDLGSFSGSIITSDSSVKTALQELETATELRPTSATLATSGGSALVGFLQSGTGAVARTAQAELRETVKITQFTGANDTAIINAAMAAHLGRRILVPYRATPYAIGSKITVPASTTLDFEPGATCELAFNGDAFELAQAAYISNMTLDGKGATYASGRGVIITGTNGKNGLLDCIIYDTNLPCIAFTGVAAGSGFISINSDLSLYGTALISDETRVVIDMADGSLAPAAVPRTFIATKTNGWATCNTGGCNDVFFTGGSYHGPFYFSDFSRGVKFTGIRWGNQSVCTVKGANHSITGCGIAPALTIGPGGQSITIVANDMNNPRVIDNSGTPQFNVVQHRIDTSATLSLKADTTAVTVTPGNNRIGVYRNGSEYCLNVDIEGSWQGGVAVPTGFGAAASINIDVPSDYIPTYETIVGPIQMTYNSTIVAVYGRLFGTTTGAGDYVRLGYLNATGQFTAYAASDLSAAPVTRLRGVFRWTR